MGVALLWCLPAAAQSPGFPLTTPTPVPGPNVNMVSGTIWPGGDPFLQRQNEPSIAVSTRNPLHILAGANDYRTVDIPFPADGGDENGDAWLGVFKSIDGGQTYRSTLIPGFPQDTSPAGLASPLKPFGVATDPTLRAGTHGLFYYSGLAFSRGTNAASAVFVAVYQDQNNKGNGNPFAYIGEHLVSSGTSKQFLDKPGMAVDIPRTNAVGSATCTIGGAQITSGKVYVSWIDFTGNDSLNPQSQVMVSTSSDCANTWSTPVMISQNTLLNQSPSLAIDPRDGTLYVTWRALASKNQPDGLLYSKSSNGGQTFTAPAPIYTFAPGEAFDQPASGASFRTITLPTIAIDNVGRVFVAWSVRGRGPQGDARIVLSTLAPASSTWSFPYVVDTTATGRGHQFNPALTYAYGRLMLVFMDQREDSTTGFLQCPAGKTCIKMSDLVEVRVPEGDLAAGHPEKVFGPYIQDVMVARRHTVDIRGALVDPFRYNANLAIPLAFPSVRISKYRMGSRPGSTAIEQLQYNPPNFPMFVHGTRPFVGDYIDVAGLTMTVDATGKWIYNTATSNSPVFVATWTDNRDVRPPPVVCKLGVCEQDWAAYTPVESTGEISIFDSSQSKPLCIPGATGSKNQNVYSSRITQGLVYGIRENSKSLISSSGSPLQREFAVFVQNNTNNTAYYRLTIIAPLPPNTIASFLQNGSQLTLDVTLLPLSSASRTVYVTSSSNHAKVNVSVTQINGLGGAITPNALTGTAIVNPDITNPDIVNPDIVNPDITNPDIVNPDITNPDITTAEIYNPTVTNPDITNPDITNPDITNPDIVNPDITNPDIVNPDITTLMVVNPDIVNPDITNPDIVNPDIVNPDIVNPDITNLPADGASDLTWKLTNTGNTSSSYNAKILLKRDNFCCPAGCPGGANCPAACFKCQLIIYKTYPTPVANACSLTVENQNILVSNIPNPTFVNGANTGTPDNSGNPTNPTITLGPGEAGRITLRVFGLNTPPPPDTFKPVGVTGTNTGQTAPAASLVLDSLQLPVALPGVPYVGHLHSTGGAGPTRTFSIFQGSLPSGLTLDPATGTITGTLTAIGSTDVGFQVKDSPTPPTQPQIDHTIVSIQANQLAVTAITAAGNASGYAGKTATVSLTVANNGPAAASSVAPSVATVAGTGNAAGVCTLASPFPSITGNGSQVYAFNCAMTGNGTLSFRGAAAALYVNSGGSTPVTAPPMVSNTIKVDTQAPVLTANASSNGSPYTAGGWTNHSVSVTFSCVDNAAPSAPSLPPSGVAAGSPTGATTLTTQTGGATVTGACADQAGNTSTLNFGPVRIDLSPPSVQFTVTPPANPQGWNNTNVSVSFTATDNLAPVRTIPASPLSFTTDGAGQTKTVTATDDAGNAITVTSPAINIDKTAPTVTVTAPASGGSYTLNSVVTASFSCADALSGIATCTGTVANGAAIDTATTGTKSFVVTATDVAGNTKTTTVSYTVH